MWSELTETGRARFVERYTDPLSGKRKKISVVLDKDNLKNRRLAADILEQRIEEKLSPTASLYSKEMTLAELIDIYRDYQKRTVATSTYTRNYYAEEKIKKVLGADTRVVNLNAGYVKAAIVKKCNAASTINEVLKRFKALIRWAYQNDYVSDASYLEKIKSVPDKEAKEKLEHKFLEREELALLLDAMDKPHWKRLTTLLALTGLRVGEALALTSDDVDLDARVIHVTKTLDANNHVVGTPKTVFSNRDVFIQPELYELLQEIRKVTNKEKIYYGFRTKLFMCNRNGNYLGYNAFNNYLHQVSSEVLGREITTHVLRHTHVSLLAESGVPLETITRRVGHSNSRITKEIYLHVTNKMKERDNEVMNGITLLSLPSSPCLKSM